MVERTFRAEKVIARAKREGLEELLTDDIMKEIRLIDGCKGYEKNWLSVVEDKPLVYIPPDAVDDDSFEGTYVAICDCD